MFIFTTAKHNLLARFDARFSPKSQGGGYLYYPTEHNLGYSCSETDFVKFTSDFRNYLKYLTWAMWIWFLVGMPLILGLAFWQDYVFHSLEKATIILFPFPFLAAKGWAVFNAPNILVEGKRPYAKFRGQKEILESRIKGMSWPMLAGLTLLPIVGSYVFLTDGSLKDHEIVLGLCFFVTIFAFGCYLIFKKRKL